jgi:subtilisin-like proprotein convertase family protein
LEDTLMYRICPLIVVALLLIAVPSARAQEVKTFECDSYGGPCAGNFIPATGPACNPGTPANCQGAMVPSIVTVPASLAPCVIADLDVTVQLNHGARGDLAATLIGPDGTSVNLWLAGLVAGAGNWNMDVTLDDEDGTAIDAGACTGAGYVCYGTYSPPAGNSLSDFDGLDPAGVWQLWITDAAITGATIDWGYLERWSLRMTFADTDGDTTFDCEDLCPSDAAKTSPGVCGCGTADTDTDADGVADCDDGCPNDALKLDVGVCGCGVADADADGDGVIGCVDNCPTVANSDQADADNNGIGSACDPNPCGLGVAGAGILALSSLCALKLAGRRRTV